jgi:hypothetical protein
MKKIILILGISLSMMVDSYGQRSDEQFIKLSNTEFEKLALPLKNEVEKRIEFEKLMEKVAKGDAQAMFDAGKAYASGTGVKHSSEKAFKLFQQAANTGLSTAWVEMGVYYKYGKGREIDFVTAYNCFSNAANLNDPHGLYSKGYMQYKGLGCSQNYENAIKDFKKGASLNSLGAMYMLGLCYRNGFGVEINSDSAFYWLKKSSDEGYYLSSIELQLKTSEYNPEASELLEKVKAAKNIASNVTFPIGQFSKIENKIQNEEILGIFEGYLVRYDWSGTKMTEVTPLRFDINWVNGSITGIWCEEGQDEPLVINAVNTNEKIFFKNVKYKRSDHYDLDAPFIYDFKEAELQFNKLDNEIFISGNLSLFIPARKEPQQPMSLILSRKKTEPTSSVQDSKSTINNLKVYPNPFSSQLNIEFSLNQAEKVYIKVISIDGKEYYTLPSTNLEKGNFILPLLLEVPPGNYEIILRTDSEIKTATVVKL